MTTSYTSKLKLALPTTGELDGTWGDVVNNNITSMVEEAIAGLAAVSTWAGASHTLTTADGTTSEARCMMLVLSGAPGAAGTVITPATSKVYLVTNGVTGGYAVTVKVSGQTGISVPNGSTMWLYCNGTDIVSGINYAPSMTLGTPLTVANGGTGAATLTGLVKGNGTSTMTAAVAGTDYQAAQSVTGMVKSSGVTRSAATSGTDYAPGTSALATGILKSTTTTGALTIATAGTDYQAAQSVTGMVKSSGVTRSAATSGTDYAPGTSALATGILKSTTTTGALTIATAGTDYQSAQSVTGIVKSSGTTRSAATANTDYLAPAMGNTAISGIKTAVFNGTITNATTTGAVTIDWTAGSFQKQNEPTGTITYTFTAPPGICHLQLLIDSDGTSTAQTITWPGTVIWLGATWTATANKKAIINFFYDGTNYYASGMNQV